MPSPFRRPIRAQAAAVLMALALVSAATASGTAASDNDGQAREPAQTTLLSRGLNGRPANADSGTAKVSADGNRIAFGSLASNLVRGDTRNTPDLFVFTRSTGEITLVTRGVNGAQADGASRVNDISSTGRFVAFDSTATNLVPNDTNGASDIFVRDLQRGRTERISVPAGGGQADNVSFRPAISANGRFVAFDSFASNMIPDDTSGGIDIFLRDRWEHTTTRVSVGINGVEQDGEADSPVISADGQTICYDTNSTNLVPGDVNGMGDVYCYNRATQTPELISASHDGSPTEAFSGVGGVSAHGRYVAFTTLSSNIVPGDTNGQADVFVRDRRTDTTVRVSVATNGTEGDLESFWPSISDDGKVVSFDSHATTLIPHDTNGKFDVFVHFIDSGVTRRVSVSSSGAQGNDATLVSNLSGDGRFAVFQTGATNLVPNDTNGHADVLLRGPVTPPG